MKGDIKCQSITLKFLHRSTFQRGGVDLSKDKLFDLTRFEELREKVENSNCSEFDKDFLLYACSRFIEFNYANIAEYYCQADKETQELMEKLALVIIDMDDAIANGYVKLSKQVEDIVNGRKEQ